VGALHGVESNLTNCVRFWPLADISFTPSKAFFGDKADLDQSLFTSRFKYTA
jgi:hypothetical protein